MLKMLRISIFNLVHEARSLTMRALEMAVFEETL